MLLPAVKINFAAILKTHTWISWMVAAGPALDCAAAEMHSTSVYVR